MRSTKQAFTLIELIAAVVVLAILAFVVIPKWYPEKKPQPVQVPATQPATQPTTRPAATLPEIVEQF